MQLNLAHRFGTGGWIPVSGRLFSHLLEVMVNPFTEVAVIILHVSMKGLVFQGVLRIIEF